jgi:sugar phosphate isomerase/epimerase
MSHTAVSRSDAVEMALDLGDRLAHVHLADGTDSAHDEHLIPGRGDQPVAQVLTMLAGRGFDGTVIAEVSTRRAPDRAARAADLSEALAFARLHLGQRPHSGA